MSAGAFIVSTYKTNRGDIHRIRIQPETAAATLNGATNTAPADPPTGRVFVRSSANRRRYGIHARYATLSPIGDAPAGYELGQSLRLSILDPATYDALDVGMSATYLGKTWLIAGLTNEKIR